MHLNNLQILVTRPPAQSKLLAEHIKALGATPIVFPCLEIGDSPDPLTFEQAIKSLAKFDIVIFISPTAVNQASATIHKFWHQLPAHTQISCIGEGTANALKAQQIKVDFYPKARFNSEALLNMPQFQQVVGKQIAIVKGMGGKSLLADTLVQRGAAVHNIIAYQRLCPQTNIQPLLTHWQTASIDIIISTSNEALFNLKHLLGAINFNLLQKTPLLVISPAMETTAKQLGIRTIVVAKNATEQAIIAALIQYKEQLNGKKHT